MNKSLQILLALCTRRIILLVWPTSQRLSYASSAQMLESRCADAIGSCQGFPRMSLAIALFGWLAAAAPVLEENTHMTTCLKRLAWVMQWAHRRAISKGVTRG